MENALFGRTGQRAKMPLIDRRGFLIGPGAAGLALGGAMGEARTQIATATDYSLRIAPMHLEPAPGKVIDTPALLYCHHQDHQDEGFMGLVTYL